MIRIPEALELANGSRHSFVVLLTVARHENAIVAACSPCVDPLTGANQIGGRIAKPTHSLRERNIVLPQGRRNFVVEEMTMVWVHPGLKRGKGGGRILRHGEVLIKDQPLGEEACSLRHPLRKRTAQNLPGHSIGKNVQDEAAA